MGEMLGLASRGKQIAPGLEVVDYWLEFSQLARGYTNDYGQKEMRRNPVCVLPIEFYTDISVGGNVSALYNSSGSLWAQTYLPALKVGSAYATVRCKVLMRALFVEGQGTRSSNANLIGLLQAVYAPERFA